MDSYLLTTIATACRKLTLWTTEAADATLAGVLQQLPLLTVRLPASPRHACILLPLCGIAAGGVDALLPLYVRHCIMRCMQGIPHALWCILTHCKPVSQDLKIDWDCTVGAETLASMPTSLRRLTLAHCTSVPASSLTTIGRLSVLEKLALRSLPNAGRDDALQQLALHLPAGLTSLEFTGSTNYSTRKASAVIFGRS